jgi:hypothetical protein
VIQPTCHRLAAVFVAEKSPNASPDPGFDGMDKPFLVSPEESNGCTHGQKPRTLTSLEPRSAAWVAVINFLNNHQKA